MISKDYTYTYTYTKRIAFDMIGVDEKGMIISTQ